MIHYFLDVYDVYDVYDFLSCAEKVVLLYHNGGAIQLIIGLFPTNAVSMQFGFMLKMKVLCALPCP